MSLVSWSRGVFTRWLLRRGWTRHVQPHCWGFGYQSQRHPTSGYRKQRLECGSTVYQKEQNPG